MSAVIGGIEIQMLADLARLRQDMGDAKSLVGTATQEMQKMANVAAKVLGAIGVGLSLKGLHDMVSSVIDAAEALHDLSIQTGVSVESLSAMQLVGRTTGTTVETISNVMNKLGKNLADTTQESWGSSKAIKALGLDFNTFRNLKPDQQMLTLAQALDKFEDGGSKSAVVMTLMGREGAKLLPFMKDLASQGELVATVTSEQADMADEYNDAVEMTRERIDVLQRSMAMSLLPTMIDMHNLAGNLGRQIGDYLAAGADRAGSSFDGMRLVIRVVGTTLEVLTVLASDVAFVFKSMGTEIGGLAAQAAAFLTGNFAGAAEIGRQMKADAAQSRAELDAFQASILGTTDRLLASRDALKNHSLSSAENNAEMARLGSRYGETKKAVLDFSAEGDAAAKKARDALDKLLEGYAKLADATALKLAEQQAELNTGRQLTDAEKDYIKVMSDVRDGKVTLAQLERDGTVAKLQANMATAAGVELSKDDAAWMAEAAKANQATADAVGKRTEQLREALAQDIEANAVIGLSATQLAARTAALYRDEAAALDRLAVEKDLVDWSGRAGQELRDQAELLRQRAAAAENGAVVKEAKAAADEWKKTTDSIQHGLADALMRGFESGQGFATSFADFLKDTFKTLVLKPMVDAMVRDVSGGMQGVMGSIGQFMGMAGAGSGGSSGASAGAGKAGAAGAGSSLGWVGWIIAGLQQGKSDYEKGWNRNAMDQGWNRNLTSAINPVYTTILQPLEKLGVLSSKWVDMLSTTPLARAFGRKPAEATAMGVSGAFGAGQFAGSQFIDWNAEGGWFRSDKTGTNTAALDAALGAALNSSAQGILAQTKAYAAALALPVSALLNVSSQARIELGDDEAKNAAAVADALGAYGTALVKEYEAALAVVSQHGEAATDTLARLGEAMLTVNTTFQALGLHLVQTSVSGGAAAAELVALSGGLDAFVAKTQAYLGSYFTQAEQMGLGAGNVLRTLQDAGIDFSGANERADLRSLMEGLDPNSASGREQMAALLTVAGDFARLADYLTANELTLGALAGQAPALGTLLEDRNASRPADPERSMALAVSSNERLASIADSSAGSVTQLQALLAHQVAANQAVLARLQSLEQATEQAARMSDLQPYFETSLGA